LGSTLRAVPIVMIYQSPRDAELKRKLTQAVTQAIVDVYGLKPEQVHLYFHESDDESWGKGGRLAADR
jgi:4-oxalocrotonate tautomerase family enzyme